MNIDLAIFDFKIIGYKDEQPKIVDFEFLGIDANSHKIDEQYTVYSAIVEKLDNGHNVTVQTKIGIPCHEYTNVPKGAFQFYESETTYFTNQHTSIPLIGELIVNHFGKMSAAILVHSYNMTNKKSSYSIQPPCLSKIILQLEDK